VTAVLSLNKICKQAIQLCTMHPHSLTHIRQQYNYCGLTVHNLKLEYFLCLSITQSVSQSGVDSSFLLIPNCCGELRDGQVPSGSHNAGVWQN
jgi:hypothetical protein